MKICSKCKQKKPLSEFNKHNIASDGYRSNCKQCMNDYQKQYRIDNKEIRQYKKGVNMKLCWDNIENLTYYKKRDIWYWVKEVNCKGEKKNIRTYFSIRICPVCNEDFLSNVYNQTRCCSNECANVYRVGRPVGAKTKVIKYSLEAMIQEVEEEIGKIEWSIITKQILQDIGVEQFLEIIKERQENLK